MVLVDFVTFQMLVVCSLSCKIIIQNKFKNHSLRDSKNLTIIKWYLFTQRKILLLMLLKELCDNLVHTTKM